MVLCFVFSGPSQSGKSSLVRLLAQLCSRQLETISLNSTSDTMDLLGGFEQADTGRSLRDIFAGVQEAFAVVLNNSGAEAADPAKLMQDLVVDYTAFQAASADKKIAAQSCLLDQLIGRLRPYDTSTAEQLQTNLHRLDLSAGRHGTFEWIESVLCEALRRGSWLVIDNVNLCSASVLDRLNALFETGGRLTVSERGVLDGAIPVLRPHPDFRVFLLYDPMRGDISRAMRNRGVEIYVPAIEERPLSDLDSSAIISAALGSSAAFASAVGLGRSLALKTGEQRSSGSGLRHLTSQVGRFGLQILSGAQGGEIDHGGSNLLSLPYTQRLAWELGCSSSTAELHPELCAAAHQLVPVLNLLAEGGGDDRLLDQAVLHYLHLMTASDRTIRLKLITMVLRSASYADMCRRAGDSWIFRRLFTEQDKVLLSASDSWDARMSNVVKVPEAAIPLANQLASLLSLMVRFKELQNQVNNQPGCLLSAFSGAAGSSLTAISSEVVSVLAGQVTLVLKILERSLNQPEGGQLSDSLWDQLDMALGCFFRFANLGLTSVGRRNQQQQQQEELERLAFVHWGWLCKAFDPLLQPLGWTELAESVAKYQRLFDALGLDRQSYAKLRSCLSTWLFPLPPQSISDINLRANLEKLDTWQDFSGGAQLKFLLQHGPQLGAILREVANVMMNHSQACDALLQLRTSFEASQASLVQKCSVKSFFGLQLATVRSRLSELTQRDALAGEDDFLPIQLRLLMKDKTSIEATIMEARARLILYWCWNPSYDVIRSVEHSPITGQLTSKPVSSAAMTSSNLCEIHYVLLESAGSLSLVSCEEKCSQLADAVRMLKGFQPQEDCVEQLWLRLIGELQDLLTGIVVSLGSTPYQNNLESALSWLLTERPDPSLSAILIWLQEHLAGNHSKDLFQCRVLEVGLNLLKFHLFASLGAIDPAEKAALKYRQIQDQVAEIDLRIRVMDEFSASVGTRHPHRPLLLARKERLVAKSAKRRNQMAERGGDSFTSLSNAIRHFRSGIGAVATVIELVMRLGQLYLSGEHGSALDEAAVWCLSGHKFASSLLERHSPAFPDLVVPVVEPVARLVHALLGQSSQVRENYIRGIWPDVDTQLAHLASVVSTQPIADRLRFYLCPDLPALVGSHQDIRLLRSAAIAIKKSLVHCRLLRVEGNLVSELVLRLVASWRHELQLKQEKQAEEEAAFRTQTMCEDKDEEAELEEEYSCLFPSFREAFADLVQSDKLEDGMNCNDDAKTAKVTNSTTFSDQRLNQLKQLAGFMLEYLTSEKSEGFLATFEEDFLQRFAMVNMLATTMSGVASPCLEAALVPSYISSSNLTIVRHSQNQSQTSLASYNFYLDSNLEETQLVRPPLTVVGRAVNQLLEQFPENPVLEQILVVRDRILLLPVTSPLAKSLTGLEFLLAACQEWEKNAHRGVSLQSVMDAVSNLILRWRRLELANWRSLLLGGAGLTGLRREAGESFWLHVMGVVLEAKKKKDTVQALVRFVESASLADFQTRLDILASVRHTLLMMSGGAPARRWVVACLANLHAYYTRFKSAVDAALNVHLKAADKTVKEVVRMTRWKDTNFWSVKAMVDKTEDRSEPRLLGKS